MKKHNLYQPRLPMLRKVFAVTERIIRAFAMISKDGKCIRNTQGTQVPADIGRWFWQRILGVNSGAYWPMHPSSTVSYPKRVKIGIETSPGWSPGCMIHGVNGIEIGDYTQISQNVAILSGNHDPYDLRNQTSDSPVKIGRYCLLGFNAVILPGVVLGDYTIVGANSVVTKSFPDGCTVLAGAPAKPVKMLDPSSVKPYTREPHQRYRGYVLASEFPEFEKVYLSAKE